MRAATWPRAPEAERLLAIDPRLGLTRPGWLRDLPSLFSPGDLLVVNDAATLPASLAGTTECGEPVELRLLGRVDRTRWRALLFGDGNWRTKTEDRPAPPVLTVNRRIEIAQGLSLAVESIDARSPRLLTVRVEGPASEDAFWSALYKAGKPVQYAYLERDLALWHVQTRYASRPWAMEMPSAGRPLSWSMLLELKRRGVTLRALTHAAGLSSSGDDALDARLPLAERYDLPASTVSAIARTRREGGRVVAVGTSVVRALEGAAAQNGGQLMAGEGETNLLLFPGYAPRVVDGVLTGVHDPAASHYALLQAFAPRALLDEAYREAEEAGYLGHEFGDSTLILPSLAPRHLKEGPN